MRIKKDIIKVLPTALMLLLVAVISFAFISCSNDDEYGEELNMAAGDAVSLHFNLSLQSLTRADGTRASENGSKAENTISSSMIYFFDSDNKYIDTFSADNLTSLNDEKSSYLVSGEVPDSIIKKLGSSFKIVVLANWSTYPSDLEAGTTTIDDICNAETAEFTCSTTFETVPTIPFYGVHSYTNIAFGNEAYLSDPITLLRAMAKIEVIDKNISTRADYLSTIKSAKIYHYNATGYCAPTGVYSQDDYGQADDGDTYFVNTLHLVGGTNDSDQSERVFNLYQSNDSTWVAYIPEYENSSSSDDNCYLELEFECEDEDEGYDFTSTLSNCDVYFSADGTSETTPFNIQRNKIYRFKVTGQTVSSLDINETTAKGGWYSKKR